MLRSLSEYHRPTRTSSVEKAMILHIIDQWNYFDILMQTIESNTGELFNFILMPILTHVMPKDEMKAKISGDK